MSGPTDSRNFSSAERSQIVANVRRLSGVGAERGPSDPHILSAVIGFADSLEYWYVRVIREAVPEYRNLIIKRINPFVRRIECDGMDAAGTAARLVEDYNARNFVTAGGWALEEMAVRMGPHVQKSPAEGLDVQRVDPETGDYHLYVIKSGLVTRNSDILKSLKKNARQAEKLLKQGRDRVSVVANYAIAAGKTSSTFEDGIRRPSSAEFWSEMTGLPVPQSLDLALAVAAEAGRLVRRDAADHIRAMKTVVADYIAQRDAAGSVDWEYIAVRNMQAEGEWKGEDISRHAKAMANLKATGYEITRRARDKAR